MSELQKLIERLKKGIARNASYLSCIRHPHLLVASLEELYYLIGNEKIKDSVAVQVSHLIMVKKRAQDNSGITEDNAMLNTVIAGPPGIGKTLIGTKLAKIWYALGFLEAPKQQSQMKQVMKNVLNTAGINPGGNSNNDDETTLLITMVIIFGIVLSSVVSFGWGVYQKIGAMWTLIIFTVVLVVFLLAAYFIWASMTSSNSNNISSTIKPVNTQVENVDTTEEPQYIPQMAIPSDSQIVKIVSRDDFVGQFVGHSANRTNILLNSCLGKVLFIDEAYSLINGPRDEFGIEAATALNLFLSQHPKEIIVIFAGYKKKLEQTIFRAQPGLKRRCMWQFDCVGYTPDELYQIFKFQLNKTGWGMRDEPECRSLITNNYDAFENFAGDTEKLCFYAKLEHSRDYISNESTMAINMLHPTHIAAGITKLRENNIEKGDEDEGDFSLNNPSKLYTQGNGNKMNKTDRSMLEELREMLMLQ